MWAWLLVPAALAALGVVVWLTGRERQGRWPR